MLINHCGFVADFPIMFNGEVKIRNTTNVLWILQQYTHRSTAKSKSEEKKTLRKVKEKTLDSPPLALL